MITWERVKLPIFLTLVTCFTLHLLWYPLYAEYFARRGDLRAIQAIHQWHLWHPIFLLGLVAGWAILYDIERKRDDQSRIMAAVISATAVLGIIVVELLLIVGYGYVYSLVRGHR